MTSTALPPVIMTSVEGSFAHNTITKRLPGIINQIIADNHYPTEVQKRLFAFQDDLTHGVIQPFQEDLRDLSVWMEDLTPWEGKTWLEIPWLLAESFFYQQVLEIVGYFQPGPFLNLDPYKKIKDEELHRSLKFFTEIYNSIPTDKTLETFQEFCYKVLWGNRGDLSITKVFDPDMGAHLEMILLNKTREAFEFFSENPKTVIYFFDNAGRELFFDLAFINFLLEQGYASKITCYFKDRPIFVSDAMLVDFEKNIESLMKSSSEKGQGLAKQILDAEETGLLQLRAPAFLAYGKDYRQLPSGLQQEINAHDLAILKGDLNFRRIVGDRHWPHSTPVSAAGGYFPTSFLSFRTIKSEVMVGLSPKALSDLEAHAEKDWMTNGKRGTIIFYKH
jgi:hypothetical protein